MDTVAKQILKMELIPSLWIVVTVSLLLVVERCSNGEESTQHDFWMQTPEWFVMLL